MKRVRARVLFNTGTRVHKPRKGKGSYIRKEKYGKKGYTSES